MREQGDVGVAKVGAASKKAAQQYGSIDGGNFRIPNTLAGVDISPVIEEATMIGQLGRQKLKSCDYPLPRIGTGDEPTVVGNTKRGQAKAGGSDTGDG